MSLVGVRDIIGTTRENSSIYVYIINTISTIGVEKEIAEVKKLIWDNDFILYHIISL